MTKPTRTIKIGQSDLAAELSEAGSNLLANLVRPLSEEMLARFESRRKALDERLSRLEEQGTPISSAVADRLVLARWIGSQSLSPLIYDANSVQKAMAAWHEANGFVLENVRSGRWLDLEAIMRINAHVTSSDGEIRHEEAYFDHRLSPDPKDLPKLIMAFECFVLESGESDPLLLAARAHQWLNSIHPFADGNGRTARLAADWILALGGYPPISFKEIPPHVALDLEPAPRFPADHAVEVILAGVEGTIAILCS